MRVLSAVGLVLLLAHAAAAQGPYESLGTGIVVDEEDRPVANAEVRGLWTPAKDSPFGPSLVVVRTDEKGKFQVPLPVGEVRKIDMLVSDENGHAAFEGRGIASPARAMVFEPLRIVLRPCFNYRVRVLDAEGQPVSGAHVSGLPDFLGKFTQQTDHLGEATVPIPIHVYRDEIIAWHEDIGIDYFRTRVKRKKDGQYDYDGHELIELELYPWTKQKIRVVDLDGQPVPNTLVRNLVVQVPRAHRWQLTLGTLGADLSNAEGFVEIPFIEDKTSRRYVFAYRPGYHCFGSYSIERQASQQIVIAKTVPVNGTVTLPNGAAAENMAVRLEGVCPQMESFEIDSVTDAQGRFQAEVPGQSYCRIRVKTDQYASKMHQRVVRTGQPVKPLDITLQPVTKVVGKLIDRLGMPIDDENIYVRLTEENEKDPLATIPPQERLPQPEGKRMTFRYLFNEYHRTNEKGEYEVLLGPGSYHIGYGVNAGEVGHDFTITQEKSLEINFQDMNRPNRVLMGRVVIAGKDQVPAGGAVVSVYNHGQNRNSPFGLTAKRTKCDAEGTFSITTSPHPATIIADSKDRKLVGVADVSSAQEEVSIELYPTVEVSGQVLKSDGSPYSLGGVSVAPVMEGKKRIVRMPGYTSTFLQGEGRFAFDGLIPGEEYKIIIDGTHQKRRFTEEIFWFTPEKGKAKLDLGLARLSPENR